MVDEACVDMASYSAGTVTSGGILTLKHSDHSDNEALNSK